jgi:enhancing lycopene biosynthesis protein 2
MNALLRKSRVVLSMPKILLVFQKKSLRKKISTKKGDRMKCGLLLSGCGFQDGSEIQESVFSIHSLEKRNIHVVPLSLNNYQHRVTNHNTGENLLETRNLLIESARISRGQVEDLEKFDYSSLDFLVIPGGFGCALNLSDYGLKGIQMSLNHHVEKIIKHFHANKKPIGAVCIAPILLAKALGSYQPILTVGDDKEVESCLETFGAQPKKCLQGSCVLDKNNKIVSTPAYMYANTNSVFVAQGIEKMIEALVSG